MIMFKACPRCQAGDVVVDKDIYGWNLLCLQCGYMKDFGKPAEAVKMARYEEEQEVVAQTA